MDTNKIIPEKENKMEKKLLLRITVAQLRQLHELGYLSDKGKDFYIEQLMGDET